MKESELQQAPMVDTQTKPQNPVFVVGVFRSGTSLLYAVLNRHSDIALMYEGDFWNFPELFSPMRFRHNWLERQEFFNQTLSRHRLIYGSSLRGLENHQTPDGIYRTFSEGKGAAVFGEKSPFYCTRLRQLARRHPKSPFILIWRDPVEIYRSTLDAGRKVRFFRQPGMLARLVHYQEELIRQADELERNGAHVCHVVYDDLVDNTEKVCHEICAFLGIKFDPQMLSLQQADFTPVYHAANFEHLRRGVIERRNSTTVIEPRAWKKLCRYSARWHRLKPQRIKTNPLAEEPSFFERFVDKAIGHFWQTVDNVKRVAFEFLPFSWLHTYRVMRKWLVAQRRQMPSDKRSLGEQFRAHWVTILSSTVFMTGLATAHYLSNPRFTFLPFYLIPCAVLSLVVNRTWGTFAAIIGSLIGPLLLCRTDTDFMSFRIFIWNWGMRFVLLEIIVLLLDRIRAEAALIGEDK